MRLRSLTYRFLVGLCILSLFAHSSAREFENPDGGLEGKIPFDDIDLAAGIVDVGELKQTVFNNGLLGTWGWSGYIVPELPAGWYKGHGYVPDLNLWIGAPEGPWTPTYWDPAAGDSVSMGPTVSEAELYGGTDRSDWGPLPGSLGTLYSGEATVGDVAPASFLAQLPLMATSTLPTSWPLDELGQRTWPGPWGIDPQTGQVSKGRFVSDEDVFFSITDGPYADRDELPDQGYPLNIQLDVSVHGFDHPYEDFIFYTAEIINISPYDYTGLYVGVFFDADIPEYNSREIVNDRFDWVGLNRELDLAYIYDYRWFSEDWPEGDPAAYRVFAGIQFLETPQDLGLTDWHWFRWEERPGVVIPERQERIQYAVLSGDTTDLEPEERDAYFHPDAAGHLDPHFDSWETVVSDYPFGFDCTFLASSGPFDLASGDTTTLRWALVMGDDEEDLLANGRLARELSEHQLVRLHPKVGEIGVAVGLASLDTCEVTVTVKSFDHDGISEVRGYFETSEGTVVDSLRLFDDGLHGDGAPGDSVFSNRWLLTSNLEHYFLDVLSTDLLSYATRIDRAAAFWAGLGVLPPFDLAAEGQEEKIYLRWSPNPDPATAGYNLYYDSDGPGPPYNGTDANQGPSPIVVDSRADSNSVLSGLRDGVRYFINITAYDTAGRQSGFPAEVSAVPGLSYPPIVSVRGLSRDQGAELEWGRYATAAPADLKRFHVYRSSDLGVSYDRIASTVQMHYLDTGLSNGLPYIYYVTAEDSAGNERLPRFPLEITPVAEAAGFPIEVGGATDYFGATVADVDGDGANEIIVSTRGPDGYSLHLLELNGSELPGWPVRFDFPLQARLTTRAVGDLDGDGKLEIVAGSANYDLDVASGVSVYAWHSDGSPVTGWPQQIPEAYFSAVALGDLNGDGDLEIVAGSSNPDLSSGAVYLWHHDGAVAAGWPKTNRRFGFTHPTMGDLNGDGGPDILFASDSLYAWDYAGEALPGWPQPCGYSYNSPNLGDIDRDGEPEILVATLFSLAYAWGRDGTPVPGWPVALNGALTYYSALGDLDGDDGLEFVVPPFLGSGLFVLDGDGSLVRSIRVPNAHWYAFPRIGDVDGQPGVEILAEVRNIQNDAFYYFAWRLDGSVLFGWPVSTYGSNYDVTVCDVDGDGALDLVTAQGPYVMAYCHGYPYDPDRVEWATTHHDLHLTNAYGFEAAPMGVMLQNFSVLGRAEGVLLRWSVSGSGEVTAFSILRASRADGPFGEVQGEVEEKNGAYCFLDKNVSIGSPYLYKLEVVSAAGERRSFGPLAVDWSVPSQFALFQNYPNPFNPTTTIQYTIPSREHRGKSGGKGVDSELSALRSTLKIYNILGQEVRTLLDEHQKPGYYTVTWDGRDENGREVASGVYFYRLTAGEYTYTKRMVLLR
ncbi:MAG: FG-GAP-like repeat-containing protein [bacterium]